MIILDGLGDHACEVLQNQTPLEAAHIPNMTRLADEGLCGMIDPLAPGIPVGTHTGTAALMGVPRQEVAMLRRGPVEAAGIGLDIRAGDVLLRCNFATLKPNGGRFEIVDRRAGRIQEETASLAAELQDIPLAHGISATLKPATQHRAVLRLRGEDLSEQISDTDSGDRFKHKGVLESVPLSPSDVSARNTAEAVNDFIRVAYERLHDHPVNLQRQEIGLFPANGIITRGAGEHRDLNSLVKHIGIEAAVVAAERTVVGVAHLQGYTTIEDESFTALVNTDLDAKVDAVRKALKLNDLVFLHIKGTDICAHDHLPAEKLAFIERIDQALEPMMAERLVIGITGDHTTDSNTGEHTGDPVPALLHVPGGRRDQARCFNESACMTGGLGRMSGAAFLACLLDAMGATPHYRPADAPFFSLE